MIRLAVVVMIFFAACSPVSEPTASPLPPPTATTDDATATTAPTNIPFVRPTLPPTWTPTGVADVQSGDETVEGAIVDETISQAPTFIPLEDALLSDEACAAFGVNFEQTADTVVVGDTATVQWSGLPEAADYEVVLRNSRGVVLLTTVTQDVKWTFDAENFEGHYQIYAWNVTPYSADRKQLCRARGGEILTEIVD